MTTPAVSVCIPTYNGSAFLRETLDSALSQTVRDLEVIVVDDASTDATPDIIAQRKDSRLRYVRHETNQGVGATWNHAVSLARASMAKLLCHDDVLALDCLENQLPALADRNIVLVGGWRRVTGPTGRSLFIRKGLDRGTFERQQVARAIVRSGTNVIGEPSVGLFRTEAWARSGGFDEANLYMIDLEFWLKILHFGRLQMVPKVLSTFRVSGSSLSTQLARKQIVAGRTFLRQLSSDPENRLGKMDLALGMTRATVRAWGRQTIYAITGKKDL